VSPVTGGVPAQTQETVLHSFAGGSDGAGPSGQLIDVNGVLYGTTASGGANNMGTVFKITASGAESVLYSFAGGSDGALPLAALTDINGVLYGTTYEGGNASCYEPVGCGIIFKITTSGSESVLYRFAGGSDGALPQAALTEVNGVLYGTTSEGGYPNDDGTVYTVTTSGTEKVIYTFGNNGDDGEIPLGTLANVNGELYGMTAGPRDGTVFKVATSGAESVIHRFHGSDGYDPYAGLTNINGALYGTTFAGGSIPCSGTGYPGCGNVFEITTSGTEKVLHSFGGGNDGRGPDAGLTSVNGVLYGTTSRGGVDYNTGTVFKITTSGVKSTVYRFAGGSDGSDPEAGLTYVNGTLYGTTASGGANNKGTVYSLSL
jgi:uncharacterized repeat protein (TIGR03803 family)